MIVDHQCWTTKLLVEVVVVNWLLVSSLLSLVVAELSVLTGVVLVV